MMNKPDIADTELIAQQAREIAKLTEWVEHYEKAAKTVHGILFNIGAPLNDNILCYSSKQLGPFMKIAEALNIQ